MRYRPARLRLPRRTVRLRLTLLYGGLFLVCGAGLLGITYALVNHATADVFTTRGAHGGLTTSVGSPHPPSGPASPPNHNQSTNQNQSSQSGGQSPTAGDDVAQARTAAILEAQARRQHAEQQHELLVQSGIALGIMAVLSTILGWIVAGRILRPLRTITAAARDISATNLHERLALDGPADELKELGDTFDALLARLDTSFNAQRQFIANASHELRTPLARQRTVAQVALADPDATVESLRAAHERVLAAGAQQERLIAVLLTLARGQAGLNQREPFDLARLTEDVLSSRSAEADYLTISIDRSLSPAWLSGDERLTERMIVNLVDNALRHNLPGGQVEVRTELVDGRAVLSVRNTGPVVPDAAVEELFQPFAQLGAERTGTKEGLGLGLSIVQAIAAAHGAQIDTVPRAGGGLIVTVSFPAMGGGDDVTRPPSSAGRLPATADRTRTAGRNRSAAGPVPSSSRPRPSTPKMTDW